jgi:hypothetical protein
VKQLTYSSLIITWIREAINNLNPNDWNKIIIENVNNKETIFQKIAIYTLNVGYEHVGEQLWTIKENPFENINIYSDLYDLIKNRIDKFSETELEKLFNWITSAQYNKRTDQDQFRLNFLKLLSTKDPKYLDELKKYPSNENKAIISPYDVSKKINLIRWADGNREITDDLLKLEPKEVIRYLDENIKETTTVRDLEDYQDGLQNYLEENANKFLNNIDVFREVSPHFYYSVSKFIKKLEQKDEETENKIFEFFDYMISHTDSNDSTLYELIRFFVTIYKNDEYINPLINSILGILKRRDFIVNDQWDESKSPSYILFNENYPVVITTLFDLLHNEKDNSETSKEILSEIENILKNEYDWMARTSVAYRMQIISDIDSDWLDRNLDIIFNQNDRQSIPLVIGLVLGNNMTTERYRYLSQKNNLISIAKYNNKDIYELDFVKGKIAFISMLSQMENKTEKDDTFNVLVQNIKRPIFEGFIDAFFFELNSDNSGNSTVEKKIIELNHMLDESKTDMRIFLDDNGISNLIILINKMQTLSTEVWDFIKKCSDFFNDYLRKEAWCSLKNSLENEELRIHVIEILKIIVKHGDYWDPKYNKGLMENLNRLEELKEEQEVTEIKNILINRGFDLFSF